MSKELSDFNLKSIKVLKYLLENNVVEDDIIETIRQLELDYYTLLNKFDYLEKRVHIDKKSGLLVYNEEYFYQILKTISRVYDAINKASSYNITYIRYDIDDFSKINNLYGHEFGDIVIEHLGQIFLTTARPTDYSIRFGGEEFDIILPGTGIKGAERFISRIDKKIKKYRFDFAEKKIKITLSAGVSSYDFPYKIIKNLNQKKVLKYFRIIQSQADDALYFSKNTGKNKASFYNDKIKYKEIRKEYISKKLSKEKL